MLKSLYIRNGGSKMTTFFNNSNTLCDSDLHQDELEEAESFECADCGADAAVLDHGEYVCLGCDEERRIARSARSPAEWGVPTLSELFGPQASSEALLAATAIHALGRDASVAAIARVVDAAMQPERDSFKALLDELNAVHRELQAISLDLGVSTDRSGTL